MSEEELEDLVISRLQRKPRRADGNLRKWFRTLLWLNLNVSALVLLAVLAFAYYYISKSPVMQQSQWAAGPGGPLRQLLGILVRGVLEAVAWVGWFLPRRPGARLWAGVLGIFSLWWSFCVSVFVAHVWSLMTSCDAVTEPNRNGEV
jgi:hypothetical protein